MSGKVSAAGHPAIGQRNPAAATDAFLHGLSIGCVVAGSVAAVGAVVAALFLPAQPPSLAAEPAETKARPAQLAR